MEDAFKIHLAYKSEKKRASLNGHNASVLIFGQPVCLFSCLSICFGHLLTQFLCSSCWEELDERGNSIKSFSLTMPYLSER